MKMSDNDFKTLFDKIDNGFVGAIEHVYNYQKKYAKYFLPKRKLVVDFGCGQGAFLTALKKWKINAIGVDINPVNVENCINQGFNAVLADGRQYILENEGEIDGVFLAHVIEHYPADEAVKFLVEIYESLMTSGRLVIITPNFGDPQVALDRFWLSSTHVRPYPISWLQNALSFIGFSIVDSGFDADGGDTFIVVEKK